MKKLIIASSNPGKIKIFKKLLEGIDDIEFIYLDQLSSCPKPEENGDTVQENAYLKAKHYYDIFGLPTLSDDAGFEIPALNNEPGVKARRRGGQLPEDISDEERLIFLLDKIKDIPGENLPAQFPFSRCLYISHDSQYYQNEIMPVLLTKTPRRPYKVGLPTQSVCVLPDGRHILDITPDDPIFEEREKKEGLIQLLNNL